MTGGDRGRGGDRRGKAGGLAEAEEGRDVGGREAGRGGGKEEEVGRGGGKEEERGGGVNVLLSISVYSSPSESAGGRERGGGNEACTN